jgi:ABC-type nitrate/sulfonate/bicarbonate transport system substrate-binding protein
MGQKSTKQKINELRLGFVPLCDCAPLVIASELGLFEKYGLRVKLSREIGWASLRDKLLYGELEAAHALAPMVFAATAGWGSPPVPCLTGLVLNLHGNAITLAASLIENGKDAGGCPENLLRGKDRLVLGIPFLYSAHYFIARAWLRGLGGAIERKTQFVVVPPPQMPQNLKAGHLDGYCVGEPWNSVASLAGFGRIAATSAKISPLHPEKILMVRSDFAEQHGEEHALLIAALLEACRYCDQPRNREEIIGMLARREYLNAQPDALRLAFGARLGGGKAASIGSEDFMIFARDNANEPTLRKAAWILENIRDSGLCHDSSRLNFALARGVFRGDLFERGLRLCNPNYVSTKHDIEPQNESVPA